MEFMTSRGRWWKGVTNQRVEVTISTRFFLSILERQLKTNQERPWTVERAEAAYNVAPACFSPQWWIDAFVKLQDGVGLTPHVWTYREGYAKVVIEPDDDHYARVPVPKPGGTLIFQERSRPEKSPGVS